MAGSSNFIQWNPTAANQETDAAYLADSTRAGGAGFGQIFGSSLANKVFYQLSTFVAAFAAMMANKGFNLNDVSISTLEGVLASVLTSADVKAGLQNLAYASTIAANTAMFNGFQTTLAGNPTINISGGTSGGGQIVTFILVQDATGGRQPTWGTGFASGPYIDPTPGATSVVSFIADITGILRPKSGPISS